MGGGSQSRRKELDVSERAVTLSGGAEGAVRVEKDSTIHGLLPKSQVVAKKQLMEAPVKTDSSLCCSYLILVR